VCSARLYARNIMPKMIQVRDVPEHVHRTLKSRAAREGMSPSDFLKRELARAAERPTMQEWLEQVQRAAPIRTQKSPAQVIRGLRDSR
jgi:plasmid stability protein